MSIEEILKLDKSPSPNSINATVFSKLFQQKAELNIFAYNHKAQEKYSPEQKVVNSLESLIDFDSDNSNQTWIKEEVWRHFESCISSIDYGIVDFRLPMNVQVEAARKHFDVFSSDGVFSKIKSVCFYVDDAGNLGENRFLIELRVPWESEHGVHIAIKNKILDYTE